MHQRIIVPGSLLSDIPVVFIWLTGVMVGRINK
jgi:hypothetical protein